MELAAVAFHQTMIMLMLVCIGIFCSKIGLIDYNTNKKLSNLGLLIVGPALIFECFQREFDATLLKGLLSMFLLAFFSFVVVIILSNLIFQKNDRTDCTIERFASIYSNCGFFGLPLAQGLFGSEGIFYMTAFMSVFNVFVWTHGVVLMTGKRDKNAVKSLIKSPVLWATFVGIFCFLVQIQLPDVINETLTYVGNMNTPLAMIVAGVTISKINLKETLKIPKVYLLCVIKLLVYPILMMFLFRSLPIDETVILTAITAVACPTGAIVTMFSLRFEKDAVYASGLFGITTILSAITIPVVMSLSGVFL